MNKIKILSLFFLCQVPIIPVLAAEFIITSDVKLMEQRWLLPPRETKIDGIVHLGEFYPFPEKIPYSEQIFYNPTPIKGGRPFCRIYMKDGENFISANFWYLKGKKRKVITSQDKDDYLSFGCLLN